MRHNSPQYPTDFSSSPTAEMEVASTHWDQNLGKEKEESQRKSSPLHLIASGSKVQQPFIRSVGKTELNRKIVYLRLIPIILKYYPAS